MANQANTLDTAHFISPLLACHDVASDLELASSFLQLTVSPLQLTTSCSLA